MNNSRRPPVPPAVYLIADHLDAVLAAGEDLLALSCCRDTLPGDVRGAAAASRQFATAIRTLELTMAARCLQARARAGQVRAADQRYKALIDLFIAGTAALEDAAADLGDSTAVDFHAGCDVVAFLRARRVIPVDAPGLHPFADVTIAESFLVAERIELGALMDLCATFLDRLEDHYDLFACQETDRDAGGTCDGRAADNTSTACGDADDAAAASAMPAVLFAPPPSDGPVDRPLLN